MCGTPRRHRGGFPSTAPAPVCGRCENRSRTEPLQKRLFQKLEWGPPPAHRPELGPCLLFTGAVGTDGYGVLQGAPAADRRVVRAHRLAFIVAHGDILPGAFVLHRCDVRLCCKALPDERGPAHLITGTAADNTADMVEKGRGSYVRFPGESNGNAKLTSTSVASIRSDRKRGATYPELSARYGISVAHVGKIVSGRSWSGGENV